MASAVLVIACGGAPAAPATTVPTPSKGEALSDPIAADRVWPLELSGTAPSDTTVTFSILSGRSVVMRHGPPDNAIFAIVEFPPMSMTPADGATIRVKLEPLPGRYGLRVLTNDKIILGPRVTFSYAIHFQAPSDARTKYPTDLAFEQALLPAHYNGDGKVQFLTPMRPAADMIRLLIPEGGTYLLVAPK